jgi:hypothetical protein
VSSDDGSGQIPVCVLGFGRSGTSMAMRLLNLLGVQVGPEEDLLPPADADNPRGYWEPRWMIDLNDEILTTLGTVWQQPFPAEPGWERRPELDELRERARSLLEEKFSSAPLWGWKDPRVMLTLPFWQELVPNARYVICLRNPADVISSFQRRPEPSLSIEAWGDLWMEFNARALKETRGEPRMLVFYEDFFRDSREQIVRMASFLGLEAQDDDEHFWAPLLEGIEPELRHHSTSSLELAGAAAIPPAARALFLALRAAEDARRVQPDANNRERGVAEAIERIAPELWYERRLLAEARSAREESARQLAALGHEHEQLHVELEQARTEQEQLRSELSEAHRELSRSAALSEEAQLEQTSMHARLARQQAVMDGLQSSLSWRLTAPLRGLKRITGDGRRRGRSASKQS